MRLVTSRIDIRILAAFVSVVSSSLPAIAFSANVQAPSPSPSPALPPLPSSTAAATTAASSTAACPNGDVKNAGVDHGRDNADEDGTATMPSPTTAAGRQFRSVKRVLPRPSARHWVGGGFHVYPVFADLAFQDELSPLLMFDYAAPEIFPPASSSSFSGRQDPHPPRGVGRHPHRGFETVTLAFQGEIEHRDNRGHSGVIGPGDVQWMTAGRGIVHEEYHSQNFTKEGGTLEMCQLWVNLPKKHKMTKPRYQAILKEQIPTVALLGVKAAGGGTDGDKDGAVGGAEEDGAVAAVAGTVRLIAGGSDAFGVLERADGTPAGAARTFSPVQMWDVHLPRAGTVVDIPFPAEQTCIVFVRRGGIRIVNGTTTTTAMATTKESRSGSSTKLGPQDVAVMHRDGTATTLRVHVDRPDTSLLIMGGQPLEEPIAAQGPFVMNTRQELQQAMADYRSGKF